MGIFSLTPVEFKPLKSAIDLLEKKANRLSTANKPSEKIIRETITAFNVAEEQADKLYPSLAGLAPGMISGNLHSIKQWITLITTNLGKALETGDYGQLYGTQQNAKSEIKSAIISIRKQFKKENLKKNRRNPMEPQYP